MLVHGDVYKPSDRRIKSDITPVDPSDQLGHIRELKIYDYMVNSRRERGGMRREGEGGRGRVGGEMEVGGGI